MNHLIADHMQRVQRTIATNAVRELLNIQLGHMPTQEELLAEYAVRAAEAREQIERGAKPSVRVEQREAVA